MNKVILCIFLPIFAFGQSQDSRSRLSVYYTLQKYYDQPSVKAINSNDVQYIMPRNTSGYSFGLHYERLTRSGFVFGGGLQGGLRRYNIAIWQDLSGFDPLAVANLKGKYYADTISLALNYLGGRVVAGYRKTISRKIAVIARVGLSFKFFLDGSNESQTNAIIYDLDTPINGVIVGRQVYSVNIEKRFGRETSPGAKGLAKIGPAINAYECYIGVEHTVTSSWVNEISIGLEAARNWHLKAGLQENLSFHTYGTRDDFRKSTNDHGERFWDQNISIGLRFGVGLW